MVISRRSFLQTAAVAAIPRRPSVVTILCDQFNAGVSSAYGGPVSTPNLERLARRGIVFTNATCPTPFCSPSRAGLLTGRYPQRSGVNRVLREKHDESGMSLRDVTLAEVLSRSGYETALIGKWH
jgi:arylsulfatase A-like enzyme